MPGTSAHGLLQKGRGEGKREMYVHVAARHRSPTAPLQPVSFHKRQSSSYKEWEDQEEKHQEPVPQRGVFVGRGRNDRGIKNYTAS